MIIDSHSEQETIDAGRALAERLAAGDVLLLYGDLGAGKTAFVRGLAQGLAHPAKTSAARRSRWCRSTAAAA